MGSIIGGGFIPDMFGRGLSYLLRDEFNDTVAAGSVDGTSATPGPGTRSVVDTDGDALSITGGTLQFANPNDSWGDPGLWYGSVARSAGIFLLVHLQIAGGGANLEWGFDGDQATIITRSAFRTHGATDLRANDEGSIPEVAAISATGSYQTGIVLRSAGAFFLIKGEAFSEWTLLWVGDANTTDPVYPGYSNYNLDVASSHIRMAELNSPWNSDYGIATERLSGARSGGDTFTHEADCLIEFEADALPTNVGEIIDFRFRIQDATNYWQLTINDAGDLELNEVVDGGSTTRGSDAGNVAAGDRIVIICDDETIDVFEANTRRIHYTSAANFKTETGGELEAIDAGGAVKDIVTWPRTLSGAALTELEKYTS